MKKKAKKRRLPNLSQYEIDSWLFQIFSYLLDGSCQVYCKKKVVDDNGDECWAQWVGPDEGKEWKRPERLNLSIGTHVNYHLQFFNKIIHELLHGIAKELPHKQIYQLATQICQQMSPVQYARLIMAIGKNLERHYTPRKIRRG